MLIAARNGFLAGKHLPYDAEVEYLQSTGTQCIDTGIVPSATTMIDMRGVLPAAAGATRFGARNGYADGQFVLNAINTNKLRVDMGTGVESVSQWQATGLTCSRFVANAASKTASLTTSEGNTVSHVFSSSASFGAYSLFVFAYNNGGSPTYASAMRVSSLQIYSSGALLRDMIPVRFTNEQGQTEGAMYDRVSGELFRNRGTGNFVIGPDK